MKNQELRKKEEFVVFQAWLQLAFTEESVVCPKFGQNSFLGVNFSRNKNLLGSLQQNLEVAS